ncbi:MAG: DUF2723 domain-containing protein, partial [Bacteroidota bacterium]
MLKSKKLIDLLLFLSVFIIYSISASKTISFWDSSEFVASSYTLQASHPPGSPFYTIFCKTILSIFPAHLAAYVSNLISAFFGALTVVLLYRITYHIAINSLSKQLIIQQDILAMCCGLISALSLAFSTSFWTAATEAEVYTLSFALMTGMIYIMLLWEKPTSKPDETKLLLFFAFLLGLAVGVHLILISIVIPFSILVVYKKYTFNLKNILIGLIVGVLLFFLLYGVVIKGVITIASVIDIYAVNTLKLGVNYGSLSFILLLLASLISIILLSAKKRKYRLHHTSLYILFFLIGATSYLLPILRSELNSLVAERVDTSDRLANYISGQRFGVDNIPLLYGPTYNAQLDNSRPFKNVKPKYAYSKDEKQYVRVHDGIAKEVNYSLKFKMLFPRMYDAKNETNYASWTTIKGEPIYHSVMGKTQEFMKPTFAENMGFFYNYQLNWLNFRYLFWNFIGKQNDYHGLGYIKNGNWVSGFNAIDKYRVGDKNLIPSHYKNNKGEDAYYFLPFLLGLLGIFALIKRKQYLWTTLLLFATFGLGITVYVNPLPSSILVRERDYIFIGSFIIFALWVGLSLITLTQLASRFTDKKASIQVIAFVLFLVSPIQLLAKNWDNHQNRHDTFAYDFGKAYLDSCPEQAILITNGDNMTFPLWYLQDVEGYRTDVRVINFDQLNIDTHINNLKLRKHESDPIDFDLNKTGAHDPENPSAAQSARSASCAIRTPGHGRDA